MTWKLSGPSNIITGDETLDVVREGTSLGGNVNYVDGKLVKTNPLKFCIICNVQPLTGKDLLLVPEGDRYTDQLWVWMNQQQTPLLTNDMVLRQGRTYQVQSAENWGSYTKARIMKVDVGPNVTGNP